MEATERFTRERIDQHLSWLTSQGRSDNTLRAYRADLHCILKEFGEFPISQFEEKAAIYLNKIRKEQAPKTVVRKLGTYRGFGQRFGLEECLTEYKAPTPAPPVPHPIKGGVDSLEKMWELADADDNKDLMALIALCGLEGLRLHEALALKVKDLDFEDFTIKVRGKGDKTRIIPLYKRAFKWLVPALIGKSGDDLLAEYSDRGARYAITRIAQRAGVGQVASHDLRSTFATEMYRRSKDLRAVQDTMGHASSSTTEGYTQISMEQMRRAGEL